ncbi:hypothetical protein LXL04_035161 [Taraxacum kok-saghyz]
MEGYDVADIKYMGGLLLTLKFRSPKAAVVFRANKNIWMQWFNWLEPVGKKEHKFERIAWIKITGVPILAWDESNFDLIANNYGKVLIQSNSFWDNKDISHGKVGILTTNRKRIDDEIITEIGGSLVRNGINEFDDNWFSFKPFSPRSMSTLKTRKMTKKTVCRIPVIMETVKFPRRRRLMEFLLPLLAGLRQPPRAL